MNSAKNVLELTIVLFNLTDGIARENRAMMGRTHVADMTSAIIRLQSSARKKIDVGRLLSRWLIARIVRDVPGCCAGVPGVAPCGKRVVDWWVFVGKVRR